MAATPYTISEGPGFSLGITYDPARNGRVSAVWCNNAGPWKVVLTVRLDGTDYPRTWLPGDFGVVNVPQSNKITLTFDAADEPVWTGVEGFTIRLLPV